LPVDRKRLTPHFRYRSNKAEIGMPEISDDIARASHGTILQGLLTEEQFEAETGWKYRTRLRREAEGLPVIVIGNSKYYPADRARTWIMSHLRRHEPPRRGRPKKATA
jgi:hypothetical protein